MRFLIAMVAASVCSPAIAADYLGKVLAVSDGDTFTMEADGAKVRVRICGIDAPERGQAGYGQAAGVLSSMIEGKTVHCLQVGEGTVCDGRSRPTSRDRIVAQCFLDKVDIAEQMTRSGTACDWPRFSGGRYKISDTACSRNRIRRRSRAVRAAVKADETPVCNLYSITTNQAAIIALFRVINRYVGNLAPMPGVFPDYKAPIVRNGPGGRELATARWGMPSSSKALMDATKKRCEKLQAKGKPVDFKELLRMEPDGGTTNIRNVKSKHWTRWLGVENRCVVPFNSFSKFNKSEGGDIWFALDETRPLACFAGIWTNWTSVRKVKEGETTNDLYAFLTTDANAEVGAIHPKAMPVILTTPEEVETWMTAPPEQALKLQRPLPDGSLQIVAPGIHEDTAG